MHQEGYLASCNGSKCEVSCCSRGYWETLEEFNKSARSRLMTQFQDFGINVDIRDNQVHYSGCGKGGKCLVLETFCQEEDIRSLACKIFPYQVLNVSGGGIIQDTVGIYLSICPATENNSGVPAKFTEEVIKIIKKHYLNVLDRTVDVIHIKKPQEC